MKTLFFFCFLYQFSVAQNKGTVVFDVAPLEAIIKIDNQLLRPAKIGDSKTKININEGTYKVEIWAFGMIPYEQDIIVKTKDTTVIAIVLKIRQDYLAYQEELNIHLEKRRQIWRINALRCLPASIVAGYYVTQTNINLTKIDESKREALIYYNQRNDFINANAAADNRAMYELHRTAYDERVRFQKTLNYISIPVFSILTGYAVYYGIKRVKSIEPSPIFNDESPFTHVDFRLDISPSVYDGKQRMTIGLNLNF